MAQIGSLTQSDITPLGGWTRTSSAVPIAPATDPRSYDAAIPDIPSKSKSPTTHSNAPLSDQARIEGQRSVVELPVPLIRRRGDCRSWPWWSAFFNFVTAVIIVFVLTGQRK